MGEILEIKVGWIQICANIHRTELLQVKVCNSANSNVDFSWPNETGTAALM